MKGNKKTALLLSGIVAAQMGFCPVIQETGLFNVPVFADENNEILLDITFDDGKTDGFLSYTNGGKYELKNVDGELCCAITKTGTLDYANQTYLDGFSIEQGCVYRWSFDARSEIERKVECRIQLNGGDYHPYFDEYVDFTTEMQHYVFEFTMEEESDPAPRLVYNMGFQDGMTEDPGEHAIYYDNLKLEMIDDSGAAAAETEEESIALAVNQIGYRPSDQKTVVAAGVFADDEFWLEDKDGQEVFRGNFGESIYDQATEQEVCIGDFTKLDLNGVYVIKTQKEDLEIASGMITISDTVYNDIESAVFYMLYNQRCGMELTEDQAGVFNHPACHTGEAVVYDSSETKEVSGGWHDAGDYGRYVVSGAQTLADLFYIAENEDASQEQAISKEQILDEARYELEWMLKMQDENSGGVYHKVTCRNFPGVVMPEEETEELVLAPISDAATGDFCAVMAKAAVIYEGIDEQFAVKCANAAIKAWDYISVKEKLEGFTNPPDIVTGEYPDTELRDELFWAAVEMYSLQQSGKLEGLNMDLTNVILDQLDQGMSTGLGWADVGGFALYDLALIDSESEEIQTASAKAAELIIAEADQLTKLEETDAYGCTLGTNYYWGSNMGVANNGLIFLMAEKVTGESRWQELAKEQLDYLLGKNGNDICYVTCFGTKSPEDPHHRPSQYVGQPVSGMLVGGPNANLEDPYAAQVLAGKAPGLCYADNQQSYSVNEVAIYWNAPLLALMKTLE